MNLEQLQSIKDLAKFIFDDKDYILFLRLINDDNIYRAKLLLESYILKFEAKMDSHPEEDLFSTLYKKADILEDLIIDLINEDMDNAGRKIRHIV